MEAACPEMWNFPRGCGAGTSFHKDGGELVEASWKDEDSVLSVDPADIEPDGIPGTRWNRAAPIAAQKPAAVDGITRQFAGMETYWPAASGESFPIADGISDTRVEVAVAGEPRQGLLSTSLLFRWSASAPAAGNRRGGRIMIHEYAGIHLMKDLDTNDLPDVCRAHGGMLEI